MEQINRIELLGTIGSVRTQVVGDKRVVNFTMATNRAYKNREGDMVIETTWHNVAAWEGRNIPGDTLDQIEKGATAHVHGRMRTTKHSDRTFSEVVAASVEIIPCASLEEAENA